MAGAEVQKPAMQKAATWSRLPPELLELCFAKLAEELNGGHRSLTLDEGSWVLAALSLSREWRRAALTALKLRLQLRSLAELHSPLLCTLRCAALELPAAPLPSPLEAAAEPEHQAAAAVAALLHSPAFQRRSGGCLELLAGVPLEVAVGGALTAYPRLKHASLAGVPHSLGRYAVARKLAGSCFPPSLQHLMMPAWMLAACTAEKLPDNLGFLELHATLDLTLGPSTFHPGHAPPSITACSGKTATLLLEAVQACRGCRQLVVTAHWAVLSTPDPAHYATLAAAPAPAGDAQPASPSCPTAAVLSRWLGILAPLLSEAGMQRLWISAIEIALFCRASGRMASLGPARWCQPGVLQAEAHGYVARLSWPPSSLPPAYFLLHIERLAD